jgi:hypothetical protein
VSEGIAHPKEMEVSLVRTTKRFTPQLLERFRRQGRGQGTFDDYVPWHRVSRGDPASRGRSHLQQWNGRQRELLSDHEWVILLFSSMLTNLVDIREQFPLIQESSLHELSAYQHNGGHQLFPGTQEIARNLGIKHPMTTGDGRSDTWTPSTDLLLTLKRADGTLELVAIAVKDSKELSNKRKKELLLLEREYWVVRGITWLVITSEQYDHHVALMLRMVMPWALGTAVSDTDLNTCAKAAREYQGRSLTQLLNKLEASFGDIDHAQRGFWQGVWSADIPMDLRRGWRPHQPVVLLDPETFLSLNPIAMRRSAWI